MIRGASKLVLTNGRREGKMEQNRANKAEWKTYILRDYGLTDQERERREEIIDNLADALDAATRGGDYSSPIQYLADKYGKTDKEKTICGDMEVHELCWSRGEECTYCEKSPNLE